MRRRACTGRRFPNARQITLDISRLQVGIVKGRCEQSDDAVFPVDELREHGVHRLVRALLRRARDHSPALGDTVNAARIASGAAQRCPVVHIGSPVPCAVPALLVCGAQGIVRKAEQLLLHRRVRTEARRRVRYS